MNTGELVASISALAIAIAKQIPDDDELSLLATAMTQLADTLSTIAAQRELQENRNSFKNED
ncbi:MAG: hypothetical protein LKJ25_10460 [Clostridia bacterium]|jgi:hypothetical protein|nr:hypothetical protein [Clostridia bacterium]